MKLADRAELSGHDVTAFVGTPSLQAKERLAIVVGDPRRIDDLLLSLNLIRWKICRSSYRKCAIPPCGHCFAS